MASTHLRRFRPLIVALSALVLALASILTAAAASDPKADQHSWVLDHATGRADRVAHNAHIGNYASPSPTGLSPATIKSAYSFPISATAGAGKTIAIVDAYDDPTAESDLGVFSAQFSLPACTTANGCFKKVDQRGGTTYPRKDAGWALEISLDVQWAHAIAPGAHILLVEADSNSFANLLAAEDYAKGH